jgi:GNAT superfamily N-acetyltransferase
MDTVIEPIGEMAPVDDAALPLEWALWAEEPGKVIRFEEEGVTVGRVHTVLVGPSEAWVEGLWVTPDQRRKGLGRQLLKAAEDLVHGYGVGIVRGAVPAHNTGARSLAEHAGFAERARAMVQILMVSGEAPVTESDSVDGGTGVRRATAVEATAVSALVATGMKAWHNLVPLGWRFRRIGVDLMRGLAKDGRVLVTQDPTGVTITAARDPAVLTAVVGSPTQRRLLVRAAAALASTERVVVFVPDASSVTDLGVAVAAHAWCPEGLVIVEKTLAR